MPWNIFFKNATYVTKYTHHWRCWHWGFVSPSFPHICRGLCWEGKTLPLQTSWYSTSSSLLMILFYTCCAQNWKQILLKLCFTIFFLQHFAVTCTCMTFHFLTHRFLDSQILCVDRSVRVRIDNYTRMFKKTRTRSMLKQRLCVEIK